MYFTIKKVDYTKLKNKIMSIGSEIALAMSANGASFEEVHSNLEQIADEFAIGFADWFTNEKSEYSIMYGNQEKRFATFTEEYTAKELLEIYKKEKGL